MDEIETKCLDFRDERPEPAKGGPFVLLLIKEKADPSLEGPAFSLSGTGEGPGAPRPRYFTVFFMTDITAQTLDRAALLALATPGTPVTLISCELDHADLSDLILNGWTFDNCTFRHAKFSGAKLERSQWLNGKGAQADFTGTDLAEAKFTGCDLNNTRYRGANLAQAGFRRCKLTGADFNSAKTFDLTFEECRLGDAHLRGVSFHKMQLKQLDFQNADLHACDFREAVFEDCSLRDAAVDNARFEGADLRGTDLGGIRLENARHFKGATISKAQAAELLSQLGLRVR